MAIVSKSTTLLSIAKNLWNRQSDPMAGRLSEPQAEPSLLTGADLGERIDAAATRAGVNTTQLAKAAGVTWAAAKRWRAGASAPKSDNLAAIAEVCGVTLEELLGVAEGQDPPWEAWEAFIETAEGGAMTAGERRALQAIPWPPGRAPTVASYQIALAAVRSTTARPL